VFALCLEFSSPRWNYLSHANDSHGNTNSSPRFPARRLATPRPAAAGDLASSVAAPHSNSPSLPSNGRQEDGVPAEQQLCALRGIQPPLLLLHVRQQQVGAGSSPYIHGTRSKFASFLCNPHPAGCRCSGFGQVDRVPREAAHDEDPSRLPPLPHSCAPRGPGRSSSPPRFTRHNLATNFAISTEYIVIEC
jgi:hypothetical protein